MGYVVTRTVKHVELTCDACGKREELALEGDPDGAKAWFSTNWAHVAIGEGPAFPLVCSEVCAAECGRREYAAKQEN